MKYIEMNTPKGKYRVPLLLIATDRTQYYAENDGFDKNSDEWKDEMDFVMNDDYEGLDWLINNMNLSDIKPFMEKIEGPEEDESWFFESENFNIVEGEKNSIDED